MIPAKSPAVEGALATHNAIMHLSELYGRAMQVLVAENAQLRHELMIANGRLAAKEKAHVPPAEPATEVSRRSAVPGGGSETPGEGGSVAALEAEADAKP